jgi:hypothetical protein
MNMLLTAADRHTIVVDTFASWALEGMEPTERVLALGRAFIDGSLTIDELMARVLEPYRAS